MTDLEALFLDINEFTGQIPPSIPSLAEKLWYIYFSVANTSLTDNMNIFCNITSLEEAIADCYGENPEVVCDCCSVCCSDYENSSNLTTKDIGTYNWFGDGKLSGCFRA